MFSHPPFLTKGDKIAIVATARKTNREELAPFMGLAEQAGFEIVYSPQLFDEERQFAGTDQTRSSDFQYWLDSPDVKAIIAARGGYGTARMIDGIDFSKFSTNPKWLIGFSDFTVIHNHINGSLKQATLHAAMPAFLKTESPPEVVQSFKEMFEVLQGAWPVYQLPQHPLNDPGPCNGVLVGGNLSVMYSTMGSVSEIDTNNAILFLEDLDEYLYHIDRMMVCLKRAGKLKALNGIIVGHMSDMHNRGTPFGKTAEEIIKEHACDLGIPLYFGFEAGHLKLNHPLIFGLEVKIENNCLTFGALN